MSHYHILEINYPDGVLLVNEITGESEWYPRNDTGPPKEPDGLEDVEGV